MEGIGVLFGLFWIVGIVISVVAKRSNTGQAQQRRQDAMRRTMRSSEAFRWIATLAETPEQDALRAQADAEQPNAASFDDDEDEDEFMGTISLIADDCPEPEGSAQHSAQRHNKTRQAATSATASAAASAATSTALTAATETPAPQAAQPTGSPQAQGWDFQNWTLEQVILIGDAIAKPRSRESWRPRL